MLWVLGFGVVVAVAAVDNNQVPKTGFSCEGRTTGYYADVDSGCQVYHMCDGLGRQFSYTCPNATLFQQRMLICDHWYMVNCSKSVDDYTANLRIGQKEMPFVDDSESNPYYRTPRPDLLAHHSQSEYDIIYRTGRAQYGTNLNLVGAESGKNSTSTSTTDEPTYSLPSHWSTEYNQGGTTSKPNKITFNKKNPESAIKGKPINPGASTEVPVNYKSYFKNTTPVFPKTVDVSTEVPDSVGLVPPLPYQVASRTNAEPESTESSLSPEPVSTSTVRVNYQSNFKATTPVYPTSVDPTSEDPGQAGVLPPVDASSSTNSTDEVQVPLLSLDVLPPAVEANVNRSTNMPAVPPSKFYQPPRFEPDYTDVADQRQGGFKPLNTNEWEDLRKKFLIPDYEFPLESVSRPSYDTVFSSFQASKVPSKKK